MFESLSKPSMLPMWMPWLLYNWIARPLYNPPKTFLLEGRYKNRGNLLCAHNGKPYSRREDRLPRLCKKENSRPFGYHSFRRAFA